MTKRFITRKDLLESLDIETLKSFIYKVLDEVDNCQTAPYYNPNLDKLGHEVLRAAFEFGLVNLNSGCPGCSDSCDSTGDSTNENSEEKDSSKLTTPTLAKIIPFKKLN